MPYDNLSRQSCTSCMVCGKAVDEIKEERIIWYMERSTPRDEPEFITKLKREAGSLLFFLLQCRRLSPVTGIVTPQRRPDRT